MNENYWYKGTKNEKEAVPHTIDFFNLDVEDPQYEITGILRNSWDYFGLIPAERPYLNVAEVMPTIYSFENTSERVYVEREEHEWPSFGMRNGEWVFYISPDSVFTYENLVEYFSGHRILMRLHDQYVNEKIKGVDNGAHYLYEGRTWVSGFEQENGYSKITISYSIYKDRGIKDYPLYVIIMWLNYDGSLLYEAPYSYDEPPRSDIPPIPDYDPNTGEPITGDPGEWDNYDPNSPEPVDDTTTYKVKSGTLIVYCTLIDHSYIELAKYEEVRRAGSDYTFTCPWIEITGENDPIKIRDGRMNGLYFPDGATPTTDAVLSGKIKEGVNRKIVEYCPAVLHFNENLEPGGASKPHGIGIYTVDEYSFDVETGTLYIS